MKNYLFLLLVLSSFMSCAKNVTVDGDSQYNSFLVDGVEYKVADEQWVADMHGNHRAIVEVNTTDPAVKAIIKWRRPDLHPETKKIVITDASGNEVKNISVEELTSEQGTIVFEPVSGPGTYYIYYLPYKFRKGWDDARYGKPWNDYLLPEYKVESSWINQVPATDQLSLAQLKGFESRTRFDFFTPMGLIATKADEDSIQSKFTSNPVVFIEDRAFPIKVKNHLPYKWVKESTHNDFVGYAAPNEYYTWQIGIWTPFDKVDKVRLAFSNLVNGSSVISSNEITCFNQEGTNWDGSHLAFDVNVAKGQLQPLWCGVQIPEDAKKGTYQGTVTITGDNMAPQTVQISIQVEGAPLADKGDGDLWRHSRLRWLNSQIGVDSMPVTPYDAIQVENNTITLTNKVVTLSDNGMIQNVSLNNRTLCAKPLAFVISTNKGDIVYNSNDLKISLVAPGLIEWTSSAVQSGISISCNAYAEYDGYINYKISVSSKEDVTVKNISLIADYTPYASKYMMGAGYKGGLTPKKYTWSWEGPYDSYWMGNEMIGAHVEFRGGKYHGPLLNDYKPAPPASWANNGKGKIEVTHKEGANATVVASTGSTTINATPLTFEFNVLLTPVKELNSKKHFSERYFHAEPSRFNEAATEGANIANIHHARNLNPVINYPFIVRDSLIQFINEQHDNDRKVKLYYTIRELTNYTQEIHALMSLGNEIFIEGPGYGTPWQMEHLIDGYRAAWYTELPGENADAALVLTGFSRWINYYLEGLRWMFENYQIDGIYMDDVSFDRNVMKRMRKIMEQYRPGALIDLHSNTDYSKGPMNQYTDFFPYIDRLWFGEHFWYNKMNPDEWFVTFSGIPFGMMSEMLQDGGNPFLGMVYGTTARHSYGQFSPTPVWNLWESFGIGDAKMVGYWNEDAPVTTTNDDIKATSYVKDGATLIALGNFSNKKQTTRLNINWSALNIDPSKATIVIPAVEDFQVSGQLNATDQIEINPKEGLLLIVSDK